MLEAGTPLPHHCTARVPQPIMCLTDWWARAGCGRKALADSAGRPASVRSPGLLVGRSARICVGATQVRLWMSPAPGHRYVCGKRLCCCFIRSPKVCVRGRTTPCQAHRPVDGHQSRHQCTSEPPACPTSVPRSRTTCLIIFSDTMLARLLGHSPAMTSRQLIAWIK
jgi:hypothetical protein